jgi:hypothetical protein
MPTVPQNPDLTIDPLSTTPASTVSVAGSGFTPYSSYRVLFDDEEVATGAMDEYGHAMTSFTVPSRPPGDYLVDMIDEPGRVQIAVLRITNGMENKVSAMLAAPNDTQIGLMGKAVTAYFPDEKVGWIEEDDYHSAIKIVADAPLEDGQRVTIFGKMATDGYTRQIVVSCMEINPQSSDIHPLFMTNLATGGSNLNSFTHGVYSGVGLYNVGMLVSTSGLVTATGSGFFYVDDGSHVMDGSGNTGVRVSTQGLTNPTSLFVLVRGIINNPIYEPTGDPIRTILPRRQSDIVPLGGD